MCDVSRFANEQAIFEKWLEEFLSVNPYFADRPVDVWRRPFVSDNCWVIRAMYLTGDVPRQFWLNGYSIMGVFDRKPDFGWREGRRAVPL